MKSVSPFVGNQEAQKKQAGLHTLRRVLQAGGLYRVRMMFNLPIIILASLLSMVIPQNK